MEVKQFFEENGNKKGIQTTESGLQYKVIKEGEGGTPKAADYVSVHYAGRLLDGTEFDSSYERNQPAEFPVNGVIPGWVEALQMMNEGSKWEVFIPPELGYGSQGAGGIIPPNAGLIFEVELLKIK
jgi:FKBP-type peptidyl-prolyl cis-trans isomerase FklB